jgi:hypothetical protein
MAFEQLVAEAALKKEKKKDKPKKDDIVTASASGAADRTAEEIAADAPNVPKR